jgi:cupin fold WbuC family metalloprotein
MKHIYSKKEPYKLLHVINRLDDIVEQRTNVAPDHQFLQLATIKMEKGKTFRPHQHIWKESPTEKIISQESWVVFKGSVKVYFYDIDGELLTEEVISSGDCSMTFEGGHTYEILEDDTIVYEYKTGPYMGIENDKVFL